MAEGALFHLAGKVLNALRSIIAEEVKLACGVKTEIENLKRRVSTIQAVLLDAEKRSSQNHGIKVWLSELKDVLHDADDVLDDFSTEVLRHKVMSGNKMTKEVRIFFSSSNQLAFSLRVGHEIKAIGERIDAIAKDKQAFDFSQSLVEPEVMNWGRETYSFVLEDEVIGRENDKEVIMERLFDDSVEENISIIPIVGIGGLGKTTLAQLVYNDVDVQSKFEIKLWVCISDIFDLHRILKEIVKQLAEGMHEGGLETLQKKLREKLNGKKYLIILDDLWNEDSNKWLRLRDLLKGGARGSRIVVTTRSLEVVKVTSTTSHYQLKGLAPDKAWSLFVKMAFEEPKEAKNQNFVALGKQIVEKCNGVPLAIRTIGSLLNGKTVGEWGTFLEDELSKVGQQENDISLTLKLSYDHLPSHLKQCFAYCSLFLKDYRIDVNTLIFLWVAQGFIVLESPRQRFVDIGRKYFVKLLCRSFFQDVEKDELGNITSCKMHDLMHDLATLVSRTESVILNSCGQNVIEKVHHVSFDLADSLSQFSIPVANKRKLRTILAASVGGKLGIPTCDVPFSNLKYLSTLDLSCLRNFKYLRTLDMSCLRLCEVPHLIGELSHLRHLDLSENNDIEFLPDSIIKLLNLQTLNLCRCRRLKELPQGLKELVNLRHLDVSYCWELTHMPLGLGHLISLEILTLFVVRQGGSRASSCSGGLSELKELSNLGGCLEILNLGHGEDDMVECRATNMKHKQHLQELDLSWDGKWDDGETKCFDDMSLVGLQPHPNLKRFSLAFYMGVGIPWLSSITNLVKLELSYNKRLQHLPPLNQLLFLKSISLESMEALEWIDKESVSNVLGGSSSSSSKTPFFPSLSSLSIDECPKLKGWWRNSNDDDNEPHHPLLPSFPPSLPTLWIWECPNLTSMPPFPYLNEELYLSGCSWKVLEQTMKMGAATTSTYFPLSQLLYLRLVKINGFDSLLEEGLRNLVSLQFLSIVSCDELVSLPWIGSLTSLQTLEIRDCHNLTSLPQEIRNLTSLKVLYIAECALLGQRCKRQIGEDWPFIAHVPTVLVDGQNQQEETISSEPGDVEPCDAEPGDAEPGDAEPCDAEPGDAEPGDANSSDAESGDAESSEDTSFCLCFPRLRFVIFWRTK